MTEIFKIAASTAFVSLLLYIAVRSQNHPYPWNNKTLDCYEGLFALVLLISVVTGFFSLLWGL